MSLHDAVITGIKKFAARQKEKAAALPKSAPKSEAKETKLDKTGESGDEASLKKPLAPKKKSNFSKLRLNGGDSSHKIAKAILAARKSKAA